MSTLKQYREKSYLSQRDLAVKAKVSYVTIARLETGKNKPKFRTIRALAKALKVKPDEIQF
jgi:transcriptional regulator with XRE-family HTH domain